jgi:NADH-quinone oxidoreductase subunit A
MDSINPLLIYAAVLVGFVAANLILAHVAGPRKKTTVKEMPYESGMDPVGDARQPFDVKFYLVAILFVVFDVELLFLYPWAVSAYVESTVSSSFPAILPPLASIESTFLLPWVVNSISGVDPGIPAELRGTVFVMMLVFMATLAIAYVYAWRKGVFRWR